MSEFQKTERTTITRLAKRASYDRETIYSILDEALYCTVAFALNGEPAQLPTGFCRMGNKLYIHGSVGSFYMRELAERELPVCIAVTCLDGLVLARSAFHHSMNYRSVVLFSKPERIKDEDELNRVLEVFTNKMQPGRWDDVRKPTAAEWKATMVLAFPVEEVSAKIRTGPPKDDEEDYKLDVWAGVVPLQTVRLTPVADPVLKEGVELPDYLKYTLRAAENDK
jgi:nitroimidazol reductase NimA-like FMN-containing flavoprotein (pyridoxamine 5'-phosphate oxidase superfamily)